MKTPSRLSRGLRAKLRAKRRGFSRSRRAPPTLVLATLLSPNSRPEFPIRESAQVARPPRSPHRFDHTLKRKANCFCSYQKPAERDGRINHLDVAFCAGFWTPATKRRSARSTGRRTKSAKARSRGRLGGGDAASYRIWPRRKFCVIGWWPDHNFSVSAQSLLIGEINLRLSCDSKGLRVAKTSQFATSALGR